MWKGERGGGETHMGLVRIALLCIIPTNRLEVLVSLVGPPSITAKIPKGARAVNQLLLTATRAQVTYSERAQAAINWVKTCHLAIYVRYFLQHKLLVHTLAHTSPERHKTASLEEVLPFQSSNSTEGPAGAALPLVLDRSDSSLCPPVH